MCPPLPAPPLRVHKKSSTSTSPCEKNRTCEVFQGVAQSIPTPAEHLFGSMVLWCVQGSPLYVVCACPTLPPGTTSLLHSVGIQSTVASAFIFSYVEITLQGEGVYPSHECNEGIADGCHPRPGLYGDGKVSAAPGGGVAALHPLF